MLTLIILIILATTVIIKNDCNTATTDDELDDDEMMMMATAMLIIILLMTVIKTNLSVHLSTNFHFYGKNTSSETYITILHLAYSPAQMSIYPCIHLPHRERHLIDHLLALVRNITL